MHDGRVTNLTTRALTSLSPRHPGRHPRAGAPHISAPQNQSRVSVRPGARIHPCRREPDPCSRSVISHPRGLRRPKSELDTGEGLVVAGEALATTVDRWRGQTSPQKRDRRVEAVGVQWAHAHRPPCHLATAHEAAVPANTPDASAVTPAERVPHASVGMATAASRPWTRPVVGQGLSARCGPHASRPCLPCAAWAERGLP